MHPALDMLMARFGLAPERAPSGTQWTALLHALSHRLTRCDTDCLGFETVLRLLPDYLFLLDGEGRYLELLAGDPERMLVPPEALLGKPLEEVFGEHGAQLRAAFDRALAHGEIAEVSYRLVRGEETRDYRARMLALPAPGATSSRVLLLVREQGFAGEHGVAYMLETVLSRTGEGIVVMRGSDQRVLFANVAVERILGLSPECLVDGGHGFLRHERDERLNRELLREVCAGRTVRREVMVHDRDGRERVLALSLDALRDADGEIAYLVALFADLTEISRSRAQLAHQATHDLLTGLWNRAHLIQQLSQALARARRQERKGAVLLLDLDRFKHINDSFGHSIGDEVLRQVGLRIDQACRLEDLVARLGGDEFVIVLEDLESSTHAGRVAEKILRAFAWPVVIEQVGELRVVPSIGIAVFPDADADAEALLGQADAAMYVAKKRGGDCYEFHRPEMTRRARDHLETEQALRVALEEDRLELFFQPQFGIASGRLEGMEALVRWRRTDGSLRMPGEFVPVAELGGLIVRLGSRVLELACRQIAEWRTSGLSFGRLGVNVSARQLADPRFADEVEDLLERYGVPRGALELEVTERVEIPEGSVRIRNVERLRALGVLLAVDDFGTGHSSLANLKRFPLRSLKIDRSFVSDVGRDPGDEAIIRAIIAMARALGLETVAEGVEHELQLAFLRELGCDRVQGYLTGRPMPATEMTRLLRDGPPRMPAG